MAHLFKKENKCSGLMRSLGKLDYGGKNALSFYPKLIYSEVNDSVELTGESQLLQENYMCLLLPSQAD